MLLSGRRPGSAQLQDRYFDVMPRQTIGPFSNLSSIPDGQVPSLLGSSKRSVFSLKDSDASLQDLQISEPS
jgi:hypothetical protein